MDLDPVKYPDRVNRLLPIRMLREEIKDERVIHLILKSIKAGVLEKWSDKPNHGRVPIRRRPSTLLAHKYPTKIDSPLESRDHKFVRYA